MCFIRTYLNNTVNTDFLTAIDQAIRGKNLVGRMLIEKNKEDDATAIINCIKQICIFHEKGVPYNTVIQMLFFGGQKQIGMYCANKLHNEYNKIRMYMAKYMQLFSQWQVNKQKTQILKEGKFDKDWVEERCMELKTMQDQGHEGAFTEKFKIITRLYEEYIKKGSKLLKFFAYQLVHHLLVTGNEKFQKEFGVNTEERVNQIVKLFIKGEVHNVEELRLKTAVAKYVEWSEIYFKFSDTFKLADINDEIVAKMFDNIENRILYTYGRHGFIILHRVSDNTIFKSMITENNKEDIDQLIQQCNDG